jgi:hypothetical protein
MSEMSERFKKYVTEKDDILGEILKKGGFEESEDKYPGLGNQVVNCQKLTTMITNSGVRWFQGKSPWESVDQALKETSNFLKDKGPGYLLACWAKGVAIGETREQFAGLTRDEVNQKIASEEFQALSGEVAQRHVDDDDLCVEMSTLINGALEKFVDHSGLRTMTGKKLSHVWDAWKYVLTG